MVKFGFIVIHSLAFYEMNVFWWLLLWILEPKYVVLSLVMEIAIASKIDFSSECYLMDFFISLVLANKW